MEKDEEKVCFELIDLGENALVHINGRGRQIIQLLLSALEKDQKARMLILVAVSMFVSRPETTKTSELPVSGDKDKRHVN